MRDENVESWEKNNHKNLVHSDELDLWCIYSSTHSSIVVWVFHIIEMSNTLYLHSS